VATDLNEAESLLQRLFVAHGAVEGGQALLDPVEPHPGGLQRVLEGLLLLESQLAAAQSFPHAPQQGLVLRLQLSRHSGLTAVTPPTLVQRLPLLTEAFKGIPARKGSNTF